MTAAIRVELPSSLRALAGVGGEVLVRVDGLATVGALLDALEADFPVLKGTIRDHASQRRRPFVRFFACEQDFSHVPTDQTLPPAVVEGRAAFLVVGAIAGG